MRHLKDTIYLLMVLLVANVLALITIKTSFDFDTKHAAFASKKVGCQ